MDDLVQFSEIQDFVEDLQELKRLFGEEKFEGIGTDGYAPDQPLGLGLKLMGPVVFGMVRAGGLISDYFCDLCSPEPSRQTFEV